MRFGLFVPVNALCFDVKIILSYYATLFRGHNVIPLWSI